MNKIVKSFICSIGLLWPALSVSAAGVGVYDLTASDRAEIKANGNFKFDVHFTVVSGRSDVVNKATRLQLRKEVEYLNKYFVSKSGENLVEFVFKDVTFYKDAIRSACNLMLISDIGADTSSSDWRNAINACNDPDVVDPKAINFFIYDGWSDKEETDNGDGYLNITSRGNNNSIRPYVLLDWARLGHTTQSPEEHEMGHAFGLKHICDPSVTNNTMSSNIMTSANKYTDANGVEKDCSDTLGGRGGARDEGFNPDQVKEILRHAVAMDIMLNKLPRP